MAFLGFFGLDDFLGVDRGSLARRPAGAVFGRDLEGLDIVFLAAAGFGFLIGQQRNAVGHRDLVVIGMDFRKGEEALAVAAIFDERRLQRGLYARYLREIDISFEWPLGCGLEVEFFDFLSVKNNDASLFGVACIDQHTFGH